MRKSCVWCLRAHKTKTFKRAQEMSFQLMTPLNAANKVQKQCHPKNILSRDSDRCRMLEKLNETI